MTRGSTSGKPRTGNSVPDTYGRGTAMPCDDCVGRPFEENCRHTLQPVLQDTRRTDRDPMSTKTLHALQNSVQPFGEPRLGYWPGTECPTHPGYPLPCAKHAREATDQRSQS